VAKKKPSWSAMRGGARGEPARVAMAASSGRSWRSRSEQRPRRAEPRSEERDRSRRRKRTREMVAAAVPRQNKRHEQAEQGV
jgi:hypothetical protein